MDKFNGDTQKIIELVARDTEGKGLLEDAITLYDLAKVSRRLSNQIYLYTALSQTDSSSENDNHLHHLTKSKNLINKNKKVSVYNSIVAMQITKNTCKYYSNYEKDTIKR